MRPAVIIKADGSEEVFDRTKLIGSLRRAGADQAHAEHITHHIESELSDGLTTEAIYRHARRLLKQNQKTAAARYSLRRALFNLGPTGFPFERFLAHLFESRGYETQTGLILTGRCIAHEVDLVAYSDTECIIAEAKFHSRPGTKSDAQVALYSHARFMDLAGAHLPGRPECSITSSYVITNTKFTQTAIRYAECVGLKLLSWNYPKEKTLQAYIEESGIYPITVLPGLSNKEKRMLLERDIVLCKDMNGKRDVLRHIGLSAAKAEAVIQESNTLCAGRPADGILPA